jgi:hypothetical protein
MAQEVCVWLPDDDRERLQRIVGDRNSPQKHVWRAGIVLASARGVNVKDVARDDIGLAGGLQMHVQAVLGDIDADEAVGGGRRLFHDPSL